MRSMMAIKRIHTELEVPATIFIVGKTLMLGAQYVKPLRDFGDLFDFQQHTYSHVPLKTVIADDENPFARAERFVRGGDIELIQKEVKHASEILKRYLDVSCTGIRGPWGYYRGLADRPDILEILHGEGIRFTSTYLRNERDWQPVPLETQPFWYTNQGFPDMLEIPSQGWQDCMWRDVNGWSKLKKFEKYLKSIIREVERRNLTWGACFHDWSIMKNDSFVSSISELISYAKEKHVRTLSYKEFYEEQRLRPKRKYAVKNHP
jgi:peptidoglycan/xylan/chitin deacetylase (PgdA/CDA1 family)